MASCRKLLYVFMFCMPCLSYAVQPNEMLPDPKLEMRARYISADLRCLVCQNQSIDDSDADLAHDLRLLVRQRLKAGDSDIEVKHYIVNRYGDYVLLNPPFKAATLILWLGPVIFLCAALSIAAMYYIRRKDKPNHDQPLSAEENIRLVSLVGSEGKSKP